MGKRRGRMAGICCATAYEYRQQKTVYKVRAGTNLNFQSFISAIGACRASPVLALGLATSLIQQNGGCVTLGRLKI